MECTTRKPLKTVNGIRLNMVTERVRHGLTSRELAGMLGANPKTITMWEKGITNPTTQYVIPLCSLYGCEASYLLHREGMED